MRDASRKLITCNNCGQLRFRKLFVAKGNRGVIFIAKKHPVVVCRECGLVFLNPQHSLEDYIHYYEQFDRSVGWSLEKILEYYQPQKENVNFLMENINLENSSVLDIGCGHGTFLVQLQERGFRAEGLEPSLVVAEAAKKLGVKVMQGDIFNHSLTKTYDILTAQAVIEHLTDPLSGIKRMGELLKDNGYLYLNTLDYHRMSLQRGMNKFFKFVHTFYFSESSLKSLLGQAGFEIVKVKKAPYLLSKDKSILLHIIAKKTNHQSPYLKEDIKDVFKSFELAKKRDRRAILVHKFSIFKIKVKNIKYLGRLLVVLKNFLRDKKKYGK